MAETKEKKGFKAGLYAVIAGVLVAAILIGLTVFAFTTRYTPSSRKRLQPNISTPLFNRATDTTHTNIHWYQKTKNTAISSSTHIWHPMLTTATMLSKPIS